MMSIKLKRHYPLLVLFVGIVLFLVLAFGDTRIRVRFLENAQIRALYEEEFKSLHKEIYDGDLISAKIDQLSTLVGQENEQRNLLDQATYDEGVAHTNEFVSQRNAFLLSLELLDRYEYIELIPAKKATSALS